MHIHYISSLNDAVDYRRKHLITPGLLASIRVFAASCLKITLYIRFVHFSSFLFIS